VHKVKKLSLIGCYTALLFIFLPSTVVAQFAYGHAVYDLNGAFAGYRTTSTGFFTPLAGSPFEQNKKGLIDSMLSNPKSDFLYVYDSNDGGIFTYKIKKDGVPVAVGSPLYYPVPEVFPGADFTFVNFGLMSGSGKYLYILNTSTDDEGFGGRTRLTFLRIKNGSVTYNSKDFLDFGGQVYLIAGDPSGKLIFGADPDSSRVFGCSVASDGSLKAIPGPPLPANSVPWTVGFGPDGKYLYAFFALSADNHEQLAVFSVGRDGALVPIPGSPFKDSQDRFDATSQLIVHPKGKFAYALGGIPGAPSGVFAYTIENGGRLIPIAGSPYYLYLVGGGASLTMNMDPGGNFITIAYGLNSGIISSNDKNWIYLIQPDGSLKERNNSPSETIPAVDCLVGER
jgi:hypothetical protein